MVTAKATCNSMLISGAREHRQAVVKFTADTSPENKEWAKYTPQLELTMTLNGNVMYQFDPGQSYLITFDQIPAA